MNPLGSATMGNCCFHQTWHTIEQKTDISTHKTAPVAPSITENVSNELVNHNQLQNTLKNDSNTSKNQPSNESKSEKNVCNFDEKESLQYSKVTYFVCIFECCM